MAALSVPNALGRRFYDLLGPEDHAQEARPPHFPRVFWEKRCLPPEIARQRRAKPDPKRWADTTVEGAVSDPWRTLSCGSGGRRANSRPMRLLRSLPFGCVASAIIASGLPAGRPAFAAPRPAVADPSPPVSPAAISAARPKSQPCVIWRRTAGSTMRYPERSRASAADAGRPAHRTVGALDIRGTIFGSNPPSRRSHWADECLNTIVRPCRSSNMSPRSTSSGVRAKATLPRSLASKRICTSPPLPGGTGAASPSSP